MAIPSLALVPTGYKAGKLYSVLPESGVGDFTFDRNSKATRVNEDGLIEVMDNNVPRLDYTDGGCPNFLLEPQRTNLITYSEDFITGWSNLISGSGINPVVTSNQGTSPDGSLNADKVVFNLNGGTSSSDYSLLDYTLSGLSNPHTLDTSIYLKSSDGNDYQVALYNRGTSTQIITVTNQWQRFSVNGTRSNTTNNFRIGLFGDISSNTASLLLFGSQAEEGSYPTSYIVSNSGSATTRVGETCNGAGDASTFNDSEGVLMAEISSLVNSDTYRLISLNDNSNSNEIFVGFRFDTGKLYYNIDSGGVGQSTFISDVTALNTSCKFCVKYKQNDISFYVNGFKLYSDTTPSNMPIGLSVLKMSRGNDTLSFYGKTKQIQYFNTALTSAELETLTSWTSFTAMANGQNYTII